MYVESDCTTLTRCPKLKKVDKNKDIKGKPKQDFIMTLELKNNLI